MILRFAIIGIALLIPSLLYSDEFSMLAPRASSSLLLDMQKLTDERIFAVGQRGHILYSRDYTQWSQSKVPTRQMLNGLHFVNKEKGWAVGHDAVILMTQDGGRTWRNQFLAPEKEQPLFDVTFLDDALSGFAIGAYGLFLKTSDGGTTWDDIYLEALDDPVYGLPHFYRIARFTDSIYYMAGEAGLVARSDDAGKTWNRLKTPYPGSYFNIHITEKNSILVMGLRGSLLRSVDAGKSWEIIDTGVIAGLNGATNLSDGSVVVVGMEGVILHSKDDGRTFTTIRDADRLDYAAALPGRQANQIVVAGEAGIKTINVSSD